ncbi:MAG TPA: methyltransferase [Chthoniobacterales bacterium]
MEPDPKNSDKALYQELRTLSWSRLWNEEADRFNEASPEERKKTLAIIRAVGVVFSESGPISQQKEVRQWLRGLLRDPQEKIRRYAMNALPKIGAGAKEEADLLALFEKTEGEREKKFLGKALDKIGGAATLASLNARGDFPVLTEQKVKASIARAENPGAVRLDRALADFADLRIHLHTRQGLEEILRDEAAEAIRKHGKFKITAATSGLVTMTPSAPFSLADIYALRCFGTLGLVVGAGIPANPKDLAALITSPLSRRVLQAFTEGPIRYRLEFIGKGHQRGAIREVVSAVYALCPDILNDARSAPWAIEIHPGESGDTVELRPRLSPDPRFAYRQQDVPAASHPPLAAAMARLAGDGKNEIVWDPFCGSGLELIERAVRGGVKKLYGTDLSDAAISITQMNLSAAKMDAIPAKLVRADFRNFSSIAGLEANSVTLIVTNPPMGKRVPIADLDVLMRDLFVIAARVLKPGGRLIFPNPLPVQSLPPSLQLRSRQLVDLGGFDCQLEVYQKHAPIPPKK